MKEKWSDYRVVSADSVDLLTDAVERLFEQGYVPVGGVSVSSVRSYEGYDILNLWTQAVAKLD